MAKYTLQGQHVLITGSTKGIGLACAQDALELGATVLVHSRTQKDVDAVVSSLEKAASGATVWRRPTVFTALRVSR